MIQRSSPVKLLFFSGFLSIFGLFVIVRLLSPGGYEYVGGTSSEYHPPATEAREAASEALLGWEGKERTKGAAIFTPEVPAGKALGLGVRLSHVRFDHDVDTVHAAVAVRAPDGVEREGSPLRIALVIDQSGSMEGDKFKQAISAGHQLVDALGPRDKLAIVSYGTHVRRIRSLESVTEESRPQFHAALDALWVDGGTNLSGGYQAALEMLLPVQSESINRIILLSDGQANEGIVDHDELAAVVGSGLEQGVSLSTMGVGLDYDEILMQLLARHGSGNYYFIEHASQIGTLLDEEFRGLMSTTARATQLRFKVARGAEVTAVDGFVYRRVGDEYVVDLDAFFGGQQKDLLLEISVDDTFAGRVELLETTLVYDAVQSDTRVEERVQSAVLVDGGPAQMDEVVLRRVQQIRTARAFIEAMDLYDAGDRHGAADALHEQRKENQRFLTDLGIEDAAFKRVDETMEQLAEDLLTTKRHSTKGKWMRKSYYDYANSAATQSVSF